MLQWFMEIVASCRDVVKMTNLQINLPICCKSYLKCMQSFAHIHIKYGFDDVYRAHSCRMAIAWIASSLRAFMPPKSNVHKVFDLQSVTFFETLARYE